MTVAELMHRSGAVPDQSAEVLIQVPGPNDPEAPDDYTIEDIVFNNWPDHYKQSGDPLGVGKFVRAEVYIKV